MTAEAAGPAVPGSGVPAVRDVALLHAEASLLESEERFRLAARAIGGVVYDWDLRTGRMVRTEGVQRLFGYELDEVDETRDWWLERVHHDDRSTIPGVHEAGKREYEYRFLHRAGHWIVVRDRETVIADADGRPVRVVGYAEDVTGERAAQAALRESEQRFRLASSNESVTLFEQDTDLRYTWVHPQHPEFPDANIGRTDAELVPTAEGELLMRLKRRVLETGEGVRQEIRVTLPGEPHWYDLAVEPKRDAAGDVIGVAGIALDVTERKRTEAALVATEERFQLATAAADVAIWVWDVPRDLVVGDDRLAFLFGLEPERIAAGVPHEMFVASMHEDDRDRVRAANATALELGDVYEAEYRVLGADGELRWVASRGRVERDDDGRAIRFAGAVVDITDRKRAEEALRESEAQLAQDLADARLLQRISTRLETEEDTGALYEAVLDAAVGVMRADFASMQMLYPERGEGGELLLLASRGFSPQAVAFWEWVRPSSASTCGAVLRSRERVMVPDVEDWLPMAGTADLAAYRETGIRAVQTTPLVSRSGTLVGMISTHWSEPHQPAERDLRLLDIVARQAADLIERRQADAALRESEARYRALTELSPQLVFRARPDGFVTYVNRFALEFTGRTLEQLQGDGWAELVHPAHRARVLDAWRSATTNISEYDLDIPFRYHDGTYRTLFTRAQPVIAESGAIEYWIGTSVDVEDRKRAEEALREREAQLRENEARLTRALAVKDEFLGSVSHELRTPMTVILGMSRLLASGELDGHRVADIAADIAESADQLNALVESMLLLARMDRQEATELREPVLLHRCAAGVLARFRERDPSRSWQLEIGTPETLVDVHGTWIERVIENLAGNAAKYSHPGQPVTVLVDAADGEVRLRVLDAGPGVAPEDVDRVFEPFYRSAHAIERAGGAGLGLAVCKRIVELMGGRIWVRPREPNGAEFGFALPALRDVADR